MACIAPGGRKEKNGQLLLLIKSAHSSVLQKQASSPSSKVGILKQPTCPKVGGEQARLSNKYINKRRIVIVITQTCLEVRIL